MKRKNNIVTVAQSLLRSLDVSFTNGYVEHQLESHPDYPSMMSLVDVLQEMKVATHVANYQAEHLLPDIFVFPCVAQLKSEGGRFILVDNFTEDYVLYSDDREAGAKMARADFIKQWGGIVLQATADEESAEPNYRQHRFEEQLQQAKLPVLLAVLAGLLWFALPYAQLTWGMGILLLLKLMGVGIGTLLLVQSVDANNPMVQNLCGLGRRNDCNAILKSDAAKAAPWLSWSEVGFFYFSGTLLALLSVPASLGPILWLSLLALPYTVYSISYQYRKNNWCVLCCVVQALLVLEALSGLLWPAYPISLAPTEMLGIALCLLLPVAAWSFLKPYFTKSMQLKPTQQQLKKFKFNSELFNQALASQPRYAVDDELMPVVLGSKNPATVITMVSNPFCGPCATAHQTLDAWLREYDDLQLKIVFTTSDYDSDKRVRVAQHVGALSQTGDVVVLEQALNDWYAQTGEKSYDTWAQRYPVEMGKGLAETTKRQKAWCDMAEISFTPTILVNGHKLPQPYQLDDIKYLIA